MKRVALYARVSGDKQEREETINSQLAQLRTLAAQKGLTVLVGQYSISVSPAG